MRKNLVTFFSASGTTRKAAQNLASIANADLYEIEAETPYTNANLNWNDKQSRSSIEMNDKSIRPVIKKKNIKLDEYEIIFVGFPIWWYVAPTIINTFLENYDFSNKKIVLFATSGGSGFGNTVNELINSVSSSATIITGKVLNHCSNEEIKQWLETI